MQHDSSYLSPAEGFNSAKQPHAQRESPLTTDPDERERPLSLSAKHPIGEPYLIPDRGGAARPSAFLHGW
jgi:hypothetical protein